MAQIKQVLKPLTSVNLSTVTLTVEPGLASYVGVAYADIWSRTFTPDDIKNKGFQVLNFDVAFDFAAGGGGSGSLRVLLNGVAQSSITPSYADQQKTYEFTLRVFDYGSANKIQIQAAGSNGTGQLLSISGRALTYI